MPEANGTRYRTREGNPEYSGWPSPTVIALLLAKPLEWNCSQMLRSETKCALRIEYGTDVDRVYSYIACFWFTCKPAGELFAEHRGEESWSVVPKLYWIPFYPAFLEMARSNER